MTLEIKRMSEDNLRQFVLNIVDNHIITAHHIPQDMISYVFLPIGLGAFNDCNDNEIKQIGTIYEYLDKAGPRSINGFPCFFSMKIIHIEDWKVAVKSMKIELQRRKNIPLIKEE